MTIKDQIESIKEMIKTEEAKSNPDKVYIKKLVNSLMLLGIELNQFEVRGPFKIRP